MTKKFKYVTKEAAEMVSEMPVAANVLPLQDRLWAYNKVARKTGGLVTRTTVKEALQMQYLKGYSTAVMSWAFHFGKPTSPKNERVRTVAPHKLEAICSEYQKQLGSIVQDITNRLQSAKQVLISVPTDLETMDRDELNGVLQTLVSVAKDTKVSAKQVLSRLLRKNEAAWSNAALSNVCTNGAGGKLAVSKERQIMVIKAYKEAVNDRITPLLKIANNG